MFVDSHCHIDRLDLSKYDGSHSRAINAAHEVGVEHMLCVCIDLEHFQDVYDIALNHPRVSASVGVHPTSTGVREPTVDELVGLAKQDKVVAIGETGLDYYREEGDTEWQRNRFKAHIEAAKQTQKPLIIHTRQAQADTIKIMASEGADAPGGVMHCFTEDWSMAKAALDLNFCISISGIVTFKNATQVKEVASKVPLDRLLIETDSPYLAPVPYRGKPNEPAYVKYVAEYIAELRGISVTDLAKVTSDNFYSLFGVSR